MSILGIQEIVGRLQDWAKTEPSTHSPFQKQNSRRVVKSHAKVDMKVFYSCAILLNFLFIGPKSFVRNRRFCRYNKKKSKLQFFPSRHNDSDLNYCFATLRFVKLVSPLYQANETK